MAGTLDQIAGALVVALEDAQPGQTSPAAIKLIESVAPNDRVDVGQAAIDLGANWDSVNKTIDAATSSSGAIVGEVTPTYVTCETASPETIELWKMPCIIGEDGKPHTPTGGLPFVAPGMPASNLQPVQKLGALALGFAIFGGIVFGAAARYARTRYRRA